MTIALNRATTHSLVLIVQSLVLELIINFVNATVIMNGALRAQADMDSLAIRNDWSWLGPLAHHIHLLEHCFRCSLGHRLSRSAPGTTCTYGRHHAVIVD